MSDTPDTEHAQAEPVDAEFEPAPGSDKKSRKTKAPKAKASGRRLPWLTIAVVTVAASSLGGGTGWLIGRYAPNPSMNAIADRLATLEGAGEAAGTTETLNALQARISTVEDQIRGAQLRAEAFEQLIRDVAALRGRVDTLEAAPVANPPDLFANRAAPTALEDLQSRFEDAVATLTAQLETLRADTQTARTVADEAQASVQQALSLIAQAGTSGSEPSAGAPSSAALALVEARVAALETSISDLNAQRVELEALRQAVDGLTQAQPSGQGPDASALDTFSARIAALENEIVALTQASDPSAAQPSSLAERALAFAAVSRAAAGADPFPVAVAELQRLWPGAPGVSALTSPARTGAPTLDQLVASFPANAVRAATGESEMWLGVIRVERDGASGPTPAIEDALEAGDLASAVAATRALEGDAANAAAVWLAQAEARLAIEDALVALADALSRAEETAG